MEESINERNEGTTETIGMEDVEAQLGNFGKQQNCGCQAELPTWLEWDEKKPLQKRKLKTGKKYFWMLDSFWSLSCL